MLFVAFPFGTDGAGLRGDNLVRALSEITPTKRVALGKADLGPGTLLQHADDRLQPWKKLRAKRYVGYVVFHEDVAMRRAASQPDARFDVIATASGWCEQILREAGVDCVTTVRYGVNTTLFCLDRAARRRWRDRFVVFSGGAFSLRRAQDVTLKAVRTLGERHSDVLLVAMWGGSDIPKSKTMKASPHCPPIFDGRYKDTDDMLRQWIRENEFKPEQIELISPMPHEQMAAIYGDSDIGLFPNRCSGDTNPMMMEYMACGRAVVATDFSGHRDILTEANSYRLRSWRPTPYRRYDEVVAVWCEPSLEEMIELLEQAYQDRDRLSLKGRHAARDLESWSWERTARELLALV